MKLRKIYSNELGIFVWAAWVLSQTFWIPSVRAQSTIEQQLCRHDGQYVVFAQRPLQALPGTQQPRRQDTFPDRNNIQLAHEHIFFCNNRRIERDIGFGPNGRFSEETISEKYALIDNKRYDSNIISSILGPDQCYISDGEYGLRSNNCQDFAARVRQEYWRRVTATTDQETVGEGICRQIVPGDRWYPTWRSCCDLEGDRSRWTNRRGQASDYGGSCTHWGIRSVNPKSPRRRSVRW